MTDDSPQQDAFEFDELFGTDYLAFYASELNDTANDDEAEVIAMLVDLEAGDRVLDLPCGHGRIARRLADTGADVVGLDRSQPFLDHARADAAQHGLTIDYRHGDMREIEFDREFDIVVSWFTSFGYFDDATLRDVLRRMRRALVPGGRLLLETMNVHERGLTAEESPMTKELVEGDATHFLVDESRYDPHDGRLYVRRFVMRSGHETRSMRYFIRLFSLTELRDWLHEAGFENVRAFGGEGEIFRVDSNRLVVTAQRP